jgi:hypothetical protein
MECRLTTQIPANRSLEQLRILRYVGTSRSEFVERNRPGVPPSKSDLSFAGFVEPQQERKQTWPATVLLVKVRFEIIE